VLVLNRPSSSHGGEPKDGDVMDELLEGEEEKKAEPNESQSKNPMSSQILDKHIGNTTP